MGVILVFDLDQTIAHHQGGDKLAINNNIVDLFKFIYRSGQRSPAVDRIFLLTNNNNKPYIKFIDHWLRDNVPAFGGFRGDVGDNSMGPENTNNTSKYYETDNYFFDYIMDWDHYSRGGTGTKGVKDVKFMLNDFGEDINTDAETLTRTFFFDDLPDHVLKSEFQGIGYENHYIQITPPFEGRVLDKTDYSLVYGTIQGLERVIEQENNNSGSNSGSNNGNNNGNNSGSNSMLGGKRSCYKKRRTLRRSRNKKYRTRVRY